MQPDDNQNNWQQPPAAPSQAPYTVPTVQYQPQQVVPAPDAPTPQPVQEVSMPQMAQPPEEPAPQELESENPQEQEGGNPDENSDEAALLRWQGTEYLQHDRGASWYVVMAVVVIALMALAIFVLKSPTFAILVPVMAVALLLYVNRPPEVLNYTLSRKGLHINDRLYTFSQFKSFGVVQHNGVNSVVLVPRKRFQIGQTLYFPAEIGEQLVDMLAARLPMKDVKLDAIDKLLVRLRI